MPRNQILKIAASFLLFLIFAPGSGGPAQAKGAQHFTPPDVVTVSDIPYPLTTVDAGVVTLAVNLDSTGKVLDVQTLRDLPSVTSTTILALHNWTYKPAVLNGKNTASTLIIQVVFDPEFLQLNSIPMGAPMGFQPPTKQAAAFSPAQVLGATFPTYPSAGTGQGAVILDVTVSSTGTIGQIGVLRDLPTLTPAAVAAAKTWTFTQASYSNASIASKVVVAMVFRSPKAALP